MSSQGISGFNSVPAPRASALQTGSSKTSDTALDQNTEFVFDSLQEDYFTEENDGKLKSADEALDKYVTLENLDVRKFKNPEIAQEVRSRLEQRQAHVAESLAYSQGILQERTAHGIALSVFSYVSQARNLALRNRKDQAVGFVKSAIGLAQNGAAMLSAQGISGSSFNHASNLYDRVIQDSTYSLDDISKINPTDEQVIALTGTDLKGRSEAVFRQEQLLKTNTGNLTVDNFPSGSGLFAPSSESPNGFNQLIADIQKRAVEQKQNQA